MAGRARRWAEAAAPRAARASGREGGAEARASGSGGSAGSPKERWGGEDLGEALASWRLGTEPGIRAKAGTPNLAEEWL